MGEDIESVIGELRVFANESKDSFDKKRLNQLVDIIERNENNKTKTKYSVNNMSDPINLDSIMGEINSIGNRLELYGLDYRTMNTEIYRYGLRLQQLYDIYKQYKKKE